MTLCPSLGLISAMFVLDCWLAPTVYGIPSAVPHSGVQVLGMVNNKAFFCTNRLGRDESIQMVTALVLQMIQCSVRCPDAAETSTTSEATGEEEDSKPVSA